MTTEISAEAKELIDAFCEAIHDKEQQKWRRDLWPLAQAALTAARNSALEDAAKHIDVHWSRKGAEFADAIRTMKVQV